jgi:hypothetical protein
LVGWSAMMVRARSLSGRAGSQAKLPGLESWAHLQTQVHLQEAHLQEAHLQRLTFLGQRWPARWLMDQMATLGPRSI